MTEPDTRVVSDSQLGVESENGRHLAGETTRSRSRCRFLKPDKIRLDEHKNRLPSPISQGLEEKPKAPEER
jgi:hypothetical protein